MEVMKVFSDAYNEERLYSVLMDEEELCLFSQAVNKVANKLKYKASIWRPEVKALEKKTHQQYNRIMENGGSLTPLRKKLVNSGMESRQNLVNKAMKSNPGEFYKAEISNGGTMW